MALCQEERETSETKRKRQYEELMDYVEYLNNPVYRSSPLFLIKAREFRKFIDEIDIRELPLSPVEEAKVRQALIIARNAEDEWRRRQEELWGIREEEKGKEISHRFTHNLYLVFYLPSLIRFIWVFSNF